MKDEKAIIMQLTNEVIAGEHVMDTLPNDAQSFSDETQALYFSNTRKNMKSDVFHIIVNANQQLDEVPYMRNGGVMCQN